MVHADDGAVSTPAPCQFGLGKAGRNAGGEVARAAADRTIAPVVCDFPAAAPGVVVWRSRSLLKPKAISAAAVRETRLWNFAALRPERSDQRNVKIKANRERSDREKRENQSQLCAGRQRET